MRRALTLTLLLASASVSANSEPAPVYHIGALTTTSFNTAKALASESDLRAGLGIAANADFFLLGTPFSLLLSATKAPLLWQKPGNTGKDETLCRVNWGETLISVPGYCQQYQLRLQPLWHLQNWLVGGSWTYTWHSDMNYLGNRIWNTRWAYHSLGLSAGHRWTSGRFTLQVIANADIGIYSLTLSGQKMQAYQFGVNVYALYRL